MTAPAGKPAAGGKGGFLRQKLGPLPMWVWMALALLVALGYSLWQKNKAAATASTATTTGTTAAPDQTPPVIFQNYTTFTPGSIPPAGGRETGRGSGEGGSSSVATPTGLQATPGSKSIALKWNTVPGATQYRLHAVSTSGYSSTDLIPAQGSGSSQSQTLQGQNWIGPHTYTISAVTPTGESKMSAPITATPLP